MATQNCYTKILIVKYLKISNNQVTFNVLHKCFGKKTYLKVIYFFYITWHHTVLSLSCKELLMWLLTSHHFKWCHSLTHCLPLLLLPVIWPCWPCPIDSTMAAISHVSFWWTPVNSASLGSPCWSHSQTWSPLRPRSLRPPLCWSDTPAEPVTTITTCTLNHAVHCMPEHIK